MRSFSESYRAAGVDIEAGYKGVKLMQRHVARTVIPGVVSDLGGFGGLFAPNLSGMKEPVLVSGTDGVGTKQRIVSCADRLLTFSQGMYLLRIPRQRRLQPGGSQISQLPLHPAALGMIGEVFLAPALRLSFCGAFAAKNLFLRLLAQLRSLHIPCPPWPVSKAKLFPILPRIPQ